MQAESALTLPSSATQVELEGKTVYIVGTAHVSAQSVRDVQAAVAAVRPDTVAVELCEPRYQGLVRKEAWRNTNIFQVVRQKKSMFLLAQLALQAFYRRLGKQLEVEPGAEMLAAVAAAEQTGATLALIDRRIDITLKRIWRSLGFWQRMKLLGVMAGALLGSEEIRAEDIEALKKRDQLEVLLGEMGQAFPGIKKRLIDERDVYLAQKLRQAPGARIVAVVGAGHVPGILQAIQAPMPLEELEHLPPPTQTSRIWPWLIPAGILALIAWKFFQGGPESGVDSIVIWVIVTGALSALGAALALPHPLTILSAFLAAPVTTLHPAIAAGWVAGLVEAWLRPPAVADFEALPSALESFRAFVRNPVIRILLVVATTNLGASLGSVAAFAAIPWFTAR